MLTYKDDDKQPTPGGPPQALQVQCFEHKGEVVVVFSQPIQQWCIPVEVATQFGNAFLELAKHIAAQSHSGITKQ